jgi:hypothetical protein
VKIIEESDGKMSDAAIKFFKDEVLGVLKQPNRILNNDV